MMELFELKFRLTRV